MPSPGLRKDARSFGVPAAYRGTALSYAAGLTKISFGRFFAATALGMAPGTFVFVYAGGAPPGPGLYAALGGLAVLALVAYAYYRRRLGSGRS